MSEWAWWGAVTWGIIAAVMAARALVVAHEARNMAKSEHGAVHALNHVVFSTRQRIAPSGKMQVHGKACPTCGENGGQTVLWEGDKLHVACWACGDWSNYVPERRK